MGKGGTEWKGGGQQEGEGQKGTGQWAMLRGQNQGGLTPASSALGLASSKARLILGTSPKPVPSPLGLPVKVLYSMSLGPGVAADAQGQNAIKSAGRRVLGAEIQ